MSSTRCAPCSRQPAATYHVARNIQRDAHLCLIPPRAVGLSRGRIASHRITAHTIRCVIAPTLSSRKGPLLWVTDQGEARCTLKKNLADASEEPMEVLRLQKGQYFGERALLNDAPRAANVIAINEVRRYTPSHAPSLA